MTGTSQDQSDTPTTRPSNAEQAQSGAAESFPNAVPESRHPASEPMDAFDNAVKSFLTRNLSYLYPQVFKDQPQVDILEASGATASTFVATTNEGDKYFIKVRAMTKQEALNQENLLSNSAFVKEARMTQRLSKQGVPVTFVHDPVSIEPEELGPDIGDLKLHFGGIKVQGNERPYVMMVQDFQEGTSARSLLDDHEVSKRANMELGKTLANVNKIQAQGFGKEYDAESDKFNHSYSGFIDSFETERKTEELVSRGILSKDDGRVIRELMEVLRTKELEAVYCHLDPNPGNFLINEDGSNGTLIDWDTSGAAPWQYGLVRALYSIEASPFYIPMDRKAERVRALLDGFGKSPQELRENQESIEAFRVIDAVDYMHAIHVTYNPEGKVQHVPGEYLKIVDDTYESTRPEGEADFFGFGLLSVEAVLRRSISNHKYRSTS